MGMNPKTSEIRLSGRRSIIADRMMKSLRESAQLSFHTEADATRLTKVRQQAKARGLSLGYEDLVIRAICAVLKNHRSLNSTVEAQTAQMSDAVHVSVAIAIEKGLVAPTIFDAHRKSLAELAATRLDLVARAKENTLAVREMSGGTITISNLGLTRVRFFTPILNPPQVAILGIGQIAQRPWVDDFGELCVRPVLALSLTVDHRFIDGEPAGAFLSELATTIEGGTAFADD